MPAPIEQSKMNELAAQVVDYLLLLSGDFVAVRDLLTKATFIKYNPPEERDFGGIYKSNSTFRWCWDMLEVFDILAHAQHAKF